MQRNMKHASGFAALLVMAVPLFTVAQVRPPKISEDEIKRHFSKADCEGVNINHLEYFDFTGDGQDEAVVLASTCATGSAGPDVHAVVTRQPDGSLADLEIPDLSEKQQNALFGGIFYEISVKDGLLVETYHDESGRLNPLVIKYRWEGARQSVPSGRRHSCSALQSELRLRQSEDNPGECDLLFVHGGFTRLSGRSKL
jgi:hypothetical protein